MSPHDFHLSQSWFKRVWSNKCQLDQNMFESLPYCLVFDVCIVNILAAIEYMGGARLTQGEFLGFLEFFLVMATCMGCKESDFWYFKPFDEWINFCPYNFVYEEILLWQSNTRMTINKHQNILILGLLLGGKTDGCCLESTYVWCFYFRLDHLSWWKHVHHIQVMGMLLKM